MEERRRRTFRPKRETWRLLRRPEGLELEIRVIKKLTNSEQSYKGKVKTHKYINRKNQSTTGKLWKPKWPKVSSLWFRLVAKRSTWGRSHRRTTESNTTCSSSHSVLTGLWMRDRQSASTLKVHGICLTTRWMCDRRQRRRISLQRRKRA
jgi:hypothetical protein